MIKSAVAIGTFDGIHIGHRYLIKKLIEIAGEHKLRSVVVTLASPIRHNAQLLTTPEEKIDIFSQFKIDDTILLPSSREIKNKTAEEFFEEFIIKKLNTKYLIVGNDFAFGYKRKGNIRWLKKAAKKANIKLVLINPICYKTKVVSSSRIRDLLNKGKISTANRLLGRFYGIRGIPEKGRGLGKKLGFPTINIRAKQTKLIPSGVFIGLTKGRGKLYPSVINIGRRPTFFKNGNKVIEVNLLDYINKWPKNSTNIYLCKKIRSEKKFSGLKELKDQLTFDKLSTQEFFRIPG